MNLDPQHSCDKESPLSPNTKSPSASWQKGGEGGGKRQHRAMTTSWQWQKSTERKLPRIWVMHATNKFPLSYTGNSSSYSTTSQTPFHIWERSVHVHKVSVHQVPTGAYIGHTVPVHTCICPSFLSFTVISLLPYGSLWASWFCLRVYGRQCPGSVVLVSRSFWASRIRNYL